MAYKFAQPFGLIETLITGPLWRIMNKEMCVLGMSKHYQNLLESLEKWAVDRTSFWNNKTFCDNSFLSHDKCFESLCTPVSNKVQRITKEYLEIFSGFVVVSRMLHGHLFERKKTFSNYKWAWKRNNDCQHKQCRSRARFWNAV